MTVTDRPMSRVVATLLPFVVGLAVAAVLVARGLQHQRAVFAAGLLLFGCLQLVLPVQLFRLTRDGWTAALLSVGLFGTWAGGLALALAVQRGPALAVLVSAVVLIVAGLSPATPDPDVTVRSEPRIEHAFTA